MKDNIMPVKLAIQRELAYRRKVAMLQLQQYDGPGEELLPLQVQPPDSSFTSSHEAKLQLRQVGEPGEDLSPLQIQARPPDSSFIPSQSGHSRTESKSLTGTVSASASSPRNLPPQPSWQNGQMLGKQKDNLFCKICQVSCSSPLNYRQHVKGHKHKARVQELRLGREDVGEVKNKRIWCQLCNIWCMNEDAYGQHLDGQKHQKAEFTKKNEQQIMKTQKYCGLCQIWCTDESSLKLHLEGKRHILKLHTMEGKKRPREEDPAAARNEGFRKIIS